MNLFGVEPYQLSIIHEFGVSVGDFLVENDVVFGQSAFVGFGFGSDFVGGLERVVEALVDFL